MRVRTFHELMGELDYPMLIVTAASRDRRAGCLVGFATQSAIEPPRFLVCLSRANRTYRLALETDVLAVHFVPDDAADLAELFGGRTGDEVDKFVHCAWSPGPHRLPILDRCTNWFAGRILDRLDVGDHVGFLLDPLVAHHGAAEEEFSFHRAKRIQPGHPA